MATCKFTITDGKLTAPKQYMEERGDKVLDEILNGERGKGETFQMFMQYSPSVEAAICVYLQTDYAAWLGEKDLERRLSK